MALYTVAWDAEVTYVDYCDRRMNLLRSFDDYKSAQIWVGEVWTDCFNKSCTEVTGRIAERTAERSGI